MVINHHLSLMGLLATISFFAIQSPTLVSAGGTPSRLNHRDAIQSPTLVSAGGTSSRLSHWDAIQSPTSVSAGGSSSPQLNQWEKEMIDAESEHYAYLEKYKSLEDLFENKTPTRDLIEEAIGMLEKEDRPIKYEKEMIRAERILPYYLDENYIDKGKLKYNGMKFAYHHRCRFPDSCDWMARLLKMDLGTVTYLDKMKLREEQPFSIFRKSTKEMQQTMKHNINAIGRILTWIDKLVKSETLEKKKKDSESKTLEKGDSESEILEKKNSEAVISETV